MLDAIEKFRQSENGKTAFYVLLGAAVALVAMLLIKPIKITAFTNNGNGNHLSGKLNSKDKKRK